MGVMLCWETISIFSCLMSLVVQKLHSTVQKFGAGKILLNL